MAKPISNVVISTDSFATWIGVTNDMADTFSTKALTANTSTIGANVAGNSQLWGTFSANVVAIVDELRGGVVNSTASANLNITSSTIFTGAAINATSNVAVLNTNTHINSTFTYVVGGLANVTSNVSITNANTNIVATAFGVQGVATLTGNVTFKANSSLSSVVLTSNATTSNLAISVNQMAVTGNVTVDAGTLFVDAANNRVGISNTTPDADLAVTGSANVSGSVRIATNLNTVGTSIVNGAFTVNNTAAVGNTTVTGFINASSYGTFGGTVNATSLNIGANVNASTTQLNIGNATVNTVLTQTGLTLGTSASNTSTSITANTLTVGNTTTGTINAFALNISGLTSTGNTTVTGFINASSYGTFSGTVNATSLNIGANVNVSTTQLNIGNATSNAVASQTGLNIGTSTSNVQIGASAITVGNTTSGTVNAFALNISGLTSTGNTTVSGFVNVSTYGTFGGTVNAAALNVSGNTVLVGNTTLGSEIVLVPVTNTDIGSNTTSAINLFSFAVGTYTAAKITGKVTNGTNTQIQEMILAQNGTDVNITVYGAVASPPTANLGSFSGLINATSVAVGFQQATANSSVKLFAQLIK